MRQLKWLCAQNFIRSSSNRIYQIYNLVKRSTGTVSEALSRKRQRTNYQTVRSVSVSLLDVTLAKKYNTRIDISAETLQKKHGKIYQSELLFIN